MNAQLLVREALEAAAKICDNAQLHNQYAVGEGFKEPKDCAAEIRAYAAKLYEEERLK